MAGAFDPNQTQNLVEIDKLFAVKAVEHARTYWNLLEKISPRQLKLTGFDDEIYEDTLREFPEFAMVPHASLIVLDEEWMKSNGGKERWRDLINTPRRRYEKKITDYNFRSLIRTEATSEYSETNTISRVISPTLSDMVLICYASICSYANTGKMPFALRAHMRTSRLVLNCKI
ncbi:hypothetical protein V8E53_002913 [Lactarius tabidus]